MTREILLISPREPSGATWLINCLLVLGIKTYRNSSKPMWIENGDGEFSLSPHEYFLKKWLPILSEKASFRFRGDVSVRWAHEWPSSIHEHKDIIFFIRDPRDSLFSRYKRENMTCCYHDFLNFPDSETLLNRVDNWTLFCSSWLIRPHVHLARFEDYKQDATKTLKGILEAIAIETSQSEFEFAIANSTFERAAAAEKRYREQNPDDIEVINRSGSCGNWEQQCILKESIDMIEAGAGSLLINCGYRIQNAKSIIPHGYAPNTSKLNFFKSRLSYMALPLSGSSDASSSLARYEWLKTKSRSMTLEELNSQNLTDYEKLILIRSLQELFEDERSCKEELDNLSLVLSVLQPPTSLYDRFILKLKKCLCRFASKSLCTFNIQ